MDGLFALVEVEHDAQTMMVALGHLTEVGWSALVLEFDKLVQLWYNCLTSIYEPNFLASSIASKSILATSAVSAGGSSIFTSTSAWSTMQSQLRWYDQCDTKLTRWLTWNTWHNHFQNPLVGQQRRVIRQWRPQYRDKSTWILCSKVLHVYLSCLFQYC